MNFNKLKKTWLAGGMFVSLVTAISAQAATISGNITTTWYEPECDYNSIFIGSFTYDTQTHAVTNLSGILSESMIGNSAETTNWLTLDNQLANGDSAHIYTWYDAAKGGTFATVFKNNDSLTFSTMFGGDGWSPQAGVDVGGLWPGAPTTWANNPQNAYALIFIPDTLTAGSSITLTWNETMATGDLGLAYSAYADNTEGGRMMAVGMTGTSAYAYGAIGTMKGVPLSSVITAVPEPASLSMLILGGAVLFSKRRKYSGSLKSLQITVASPYKNRPISAGLLVQYAENFREIL